MTDDARRRNTSPTRPQESSSVRSLLDRVIGGGYCVGCGGCAAVPGSPLVMRLDANGQMCASIKPDATDASPAIDPNLVCPFSDSSVNEDLISTELFGDQTPRHALIGRHLACFAGHVEQGGFRQAGSSGGMGSWILCELLSAGQIDAVINVAQRKPTADDPRLVEFQVCHSAEQVLSSAKSRYHPVEMSGVLQHIREHPGRYAVVGVPCFLKAVRLMARQDKVIAQRVSFCVGLVCGHLKSTGFATLLSWQLGVEPGNVESVDFRYKLPQLPANRYGVKVTGKDKSGQPIAKSSPVYDLYGTDWGQGLFKYQACDYCDDVLAETADIAVGDAWLPQFVQDSLGTNVVVVRNQQILSLVQKAISEGRLAMSPITADEVAASQRSGLRHRREGLSYRLHLKDRAGQWRPTKRVEARADHLTGSDKKKYAIRVELAAASHVAMAKAVAARDFSLFRKAMDPLLARYQAAMKPTFTQRLRGKVKKLLKQFIGPKAAPNR